MPPKNRLFRHEKATLFLAKVGNILENARGKEEKLTNLEKKVEELLKPSIEKMQYKLYDVQYVKER